MSDDQDGCEWVNVSSGTGLPRLSRTKGNGCVCVFLVLAHWGSPGKRAVKRVCVCVSVVINCRLLLNML